MSLVIIRHHESEWNKLGKWTGVTDVHLTEYGFQMSKEMGKLITDIKFDQAFASGQVRTLETLIMILDSIGQLSVPIERSNAINERDYGDYTGKNKWDMKEMLGDEQFDRVRRDWDCPVPNGETLKMVYDRAVPYYLSTIKPLVNAGKNVIMVAHGNSIRAILKYIESISDEDMGKVEMIFGGVLIYDIDQDGKMVKKEVRQVESKVNA